MNQLLKTLEEMKKAEEAKKKKRKKSFTLRTEKNLNYYNGWSPKIK